MVSTHTFMELDWEGFGYHGFPTSAATPGYASAQEAEAWWGFERTLARAKQGDFAGNRQLLAAYDEADWMLAAACAELMGDIGDRPFFDALRPAITSVLDPSYSIDLGCSLAAWGHLSSIPTMVETLEKLAEFDDAPALVQRLSVLLEPEPGPLSDASRLEDDLPGYTNDVRQHTVRLAQRLGTADAIVMFGELFSIDRLIETMRLRLTEGGRFDPYWRHKFEATTGVDCSSFYKDGVLQPLQALAVIEEFEDRGQARRYQPGRRYFFGHLLPD